MSVDISMWIVDRRTKEVIMQEDDLYNGRNSDWFNNLQDHYNEDLEYDSFPHYYLKQFLDEIPKSIIDKFDYDMDYGWNCLPLNEFCSWKVHKNPALKAGWLQKYDVWLYHNKGIEPNEESVHRYIDEADLNLYEFIEYYDSSEPSEIVYSKLAERGLTDLDASKNYLMIYSFNR